MVTCICCSQSAPKFLVYVSLLLAIISGAGLATLARLKWDPSTYLVVRTLMPTEYRVLSGVLCFGSVMLIVLAHLALLAISIRRGSYQHFRQAMFFTYSAMMSALIIVELVTIAWLSARVIRWLQTDEASAIINALIELKNWSPTIRKLLAIASFLVEPLSVIQDSIDEIAHDLPYNVYVAVVVVALVAILQPVAVLLGLNAAYTYTKTGGTCGDSTQVVHTITYNSNHRKPTQSNINKEKQFKQMENLTAIKN